MIRLFTRKPAVREWLSPMDIWKVIPDDETGRIALELRDRDSHSVKFAIADYLNGRLTWEMWQPSADSSCGLEDFWNGTLVLHGYGDISLPVHEGVFALRTPGFLSLWEDAHSQLSGISATAVRVQHPDGTTHYLDWNTGAPVQMQDDAFSVQEKDFRQKRMRNRMFPQLRHVSSQELKAIATTGKSFFSGGPVTTVSLGDTQVISFYSADGSQAPDHVLAVFSRGRLRFCRVLDAALSKLIPEPFFVWKDSVIAIEGRRKLLQIPL